MGKEEKRGNRRNISGSRSRLLVAMSQALTSCSSVALLHALMNSTQGHSTNEISFWGQVLSGI